MPNFFARGVLLAALVLPWQALAAGSLRGGLAPEGRERSAPERRDGEDERGADTKDGRAGDGRGKTGRDKAGRGDGGREAGSARVGRDGRRDGGAMRAAVTPTWEIKGTVSAGGGQTSNAQGNDSDSSAEFSAARGKTPSAILRGAITLAAIRTDAGGVLTLEADADRIRFVEARSADELTASAGIRWQQSDGVGAAGLRLARSEEISERRSEFGAKATVGLLRDRLVVDAEAVYLDFDDVASGLPEFANQQDRDRLSGRLALSAPIELGKDLTLRPIIGADGKRYVQRIDDFGNRRDSLGGFAGFALARTADKTSAEASVLYYERHFPEGEFSPVRTFLFAATISHEFENGVKVGLDYKTNIQETDFFEASVYVDRRIGVSLEWQPVERLSVRLAAEAGQRDYRGLERRDRRLETPLRVSWAFTPNLTAFGEARYVAFESPALDAATQERRVLFGLTASN